jgi:hypothetical protein
MTNTAAAYLYLELLNNDLEIFFRRQLLPTLKECLASKIHEKRSVFEQATVPRNQC